MKRFIYIILLTICCSAHCLAQYNESNSIIRTALVEYVKDGKGFYHKKINVSKNIVTNVESNYAYDSKAQSLYVLTDNANCVVTLTKDYAKIIKKNKQIPQMKGDELYVAISRANESLEDKFNSLNESRKQQIADSIAKAKQDSIERERIKAEQERIKAERLAQMEKQKQEYKKAHSWEWIPVKGEYMKCSLCDYSISSKDSVFCLGIRNDSIYTYDYEDMPLGESRGVVHKFLFDNDLKKNKAFQYHFEVFKDSLLGDEHKIFIDDPAGVNYYNLLKSLEDIRKKAPYGYVEEWDWDDNYSWLTFNIKYTNTNKKTIKYINVFFKLTNDVNDVRLTGNLKGTGPVEQWESSSWDWDDTLYQVAGDATEMQITKIVLTYMDGTQKVLNSKQIEYQSDYEEDDEDE